jgi:hypothetical protein
MPPHHPPPEVLRNCIQDIVSRVTVEMECLKPKKEDLVHARNLTDGEWQDDVGDERLFNSIMNGRNVRGNMPAFSNKLNDQEAESLVSFVRRFRK